jgi:hypothetical protein
LENKKTLDTLFAETLDYFDKDEVEKDYESFKKMVVDAVSHRINLRIILEL